MEKELEKILAVLAFDDATNIHDVDAALAITSYYLPWVIDDLID